MGIMDFHWNYLTSQDGTDLNPWTHLWRKASYYYAHDQQFWAIANALVVVLTAVGVLLLAVLVNCARRKFTEITTLESEQQQQLRLALDVVKLLDENRTHLQEISEAVKNHAVGGAEQPVMSRTSAGLQNQRLSHGRAIMEHSEVTG
ncbi:uncharacterized protein LOC120416602 [Culex pipiens pallens]|uniref:uncharacterized protein LOC120416602 n=1 Tax=Culex pipiens pallens TaxID=42434 RepID=UPI0019541D4A|nr:uncharacterized protein LOC120416602 [Culex pipiens pallens]